MHLFGDAAFSSLAAVREAFGAYSFALSPGAMAAARKKWRRFALSLDGACLR